MTTLSSRAAEAAKTSNANTVAAVLQDPWHPTMNPNGYINLGLAENLLMHDVLLTHIHADLKTLQANALTYGDGSTGSRRLKAAIARLLDRHFKPTQPITAAHVLVTNGCTSAIEHLAWAVSNPGDAILVGQPFYNRLTTDLSLRTGAKVLPVSFSGTADALSTAAVAIYADAIARCQAAGQRIAAILLVNPHNPLGRCYEKPALRALLRLCNTHRIHVLSDEVYALSVWGDDGTTTPFHSVLELADPKLIDPALVHVIWGLSKDCGANGVRIGAVISRSCGAALLDAAVFSSASSLSDHVAACLLEDEAWVGWYLEENRRRLAERYKVVVRWAVEHGIPHARGVGAGFFLWVNLGKVFRRKHWRAGYGETEAADGEGKSLDDEVMRVLLGEGVFVADGREFGSEEPGWFRIVFSGERRALDEGLTRCLRALGPSTSAS